MNSALPPNDNETLDFVNKVIADSLSHYIRHPATGGPVKQWLELLDEIIRNPDDTQQLLDQFYLSVRNEHERKQ